MQARTIAVNPALRIVAALIASKSTTVLVCFVAVLDAVVACRCLAHIVDAVLARAIAVT